MTEFAGLFWLRPWWLLLVPLAVALGLLLVRQARDLGDWAEAMDPEMLAAMQRMGRISGGAPRRAWIPALILGALGVALAGPGVERRDQAGFRNLDAVVLVLDLSPSVTGGGALFDMLTAARVLVDSAGTRQVGLVVYAGEAYTAAPLTNDRRAITGTLALIDAETMPVTGSNPEAGLTLAGAMLEEAAILSADVVLLSDGGSVGPDAIAAARRLVATGATLSIVSMSDNPDLLALSRAGEGKAASTADPFPVARHIGARAVERFARTDYVMLTMHDLGRFVLILALVGALVLLPRRGSA